MLAALRALGFLATLTTSAAAADQQAPWRILPLGDSITLGCGYDAGPANGWSAVCSGTSGSYRAALWAALNASGADTVFVGTSPEGGGPAT